MAPDTSFSSVGRVLLEERDDRFRAPALDQICEVKSCRAGTEDGDVHGVSDNQIV